MRTGAAGNRHQFTAKNFHFCYIGMFLGNIYLAHVNFAFDADEGACGGKRNAVLSSASFCKHFGFGHVLGQQCFTDAVASFVGAGMVRIFAFQEDACAPIFSLSRLAQEIGLERPM